MTVRISSDVRTHDSEHHQHSWTQSRVPIHRHALGDDSTDTQRGVLAGLTSERNLRSKIWWFAEFCNSHYVSHFAAFFIVTGTKISIANSCSVFRIFFRSEKKCVEVLVIFVKTKYKSTPPCTTTSDTNDSFRLGVIVICHTWLEHKRGTGPS